MSDDFAARIGFFDAYPWARGGVSRMCLQLADVVGELGGTFEVITPDEGPVPNEYRQHGLTVHVVPAPRSLLRYGGQATRGAKAIAAALALPLYWRRLARLFQGRFDLVHLNDVRGLILGGPPARLGRVPVVWQVHAHVQQRWAGYLAELVTAEIAVVSASCIPAGLRAGRNPTVLPHFYVPGANAPGSEPRQPVTPPLVLSVARLYPVKGIDVLIRASALLHRAGVDHRVAIVGGVQPGYETYLAKLKALADELGIAASVDFVGEVSDPRERLADATLYVQPSRSEAFGMAVLEAMAAHVPVIVTDVGGMRELIEHERSGWRVPPEDSAALADTIRFVLDNPSLASQFAATAHTRVLTQFGREQFVAGVHDLYIRALSR